MDIDQLKDDVRHNATGSFDSAARAERVCDAIDRLQRENEDLKKRLEIDQHHKAEEQEKPPCEFCTHEAKHATESPCIDCERIGFAQWSQYQPIFAGSPSWGDVLYYLREQNQYGLGTIVREGISHIKQLKLELEEARKDAARLDFFEQHPTAVVRSKGYLGSADSWGWRDEHGATHDAVSLRDALDRAMAANHQHQVNFANQEFEKPSPNRETRAMSRARQQKDQNYRRKIYDT